MHRLWVLRNWKVLKSILHCIWKIFTSPGNSSDRAVRLGSQLGNCSHTGRQKRQLCEFWPENILVGSAQLASFKLGNAFASRIYLHLSLSIWIFFLLQNIIHDYFSFSAQLASFKLESAFTGRIYLPRAVFVVAQTTKPHLIWLAIGFATSAKFQVNQTTK